MALCGPCMCRTHDRCREDGTGWVCSCLDASHPMRAGHYLSKRYGTHVWVCGECNWGRPFPTRDDAEQAQIHHVCRWTGDNDMPQGKSAILQGWEQLDAEVDEIMDLTAKVNAGETDFEYDLTFAKAKARGKAEILALLTVPHFRNADAVSVEAGNRYQARRAGDTTYVTPGSVPQ